MTDTIRRFDDDSLQLRLLLDGGTGVELLRDGEVEAAVLAREAARSAHGHADREGRDDRY